MVAVTQTLVILLFYIYLEVISCANILAAIPFNYRSHLKTFQPLLEEILKKGHSLTLLSSLPLELNSELQSNYTHINLMKYSAGILTYDNFLKRCNSSLENRFITFVIDIDMQLECLENMIKGPEVQDLLHSKRRYDLVIAELFGSDVFFALGNKFNVPIISVTSQNLLSYHDWILGNPIPSHFPNSLLEVGVTEKMSLTWRAINMGWNFILILHFEFYHSRKHQLLIDKYFHFETNNVPSLKETMKNISVSLVNSHCSLGYAKPDLPNVVNVAGLHFIPLKPLPRDLQKFMDEAQYGVIYVSLGSILNPRTFEQLGRSLIHIFKSLPQKIIMKWDIKSLPPVTSNILVREWLPQSDILNHHNCRLFITHGGYLSLLESMNASVPVVGIPFFGDQPYNMAMVEYYELGKKIVAMDQIVSELPGKIEEVLNNPKYKQNMQRRSRIFRNRLASPLDTAMYWIDHVLEHKDTSHLKPASVRLTWYEFYSLDVLALLVVLIVTIFYASKFLLFVFLSLVRVLYVKTRKWFASKSKSSVTKNPSKRD